MYTDTNCPFESRADCHENNSAHAHKSCWLRLVTISRPAVMLGCGISRIQAQDA